MKTIELNADDKAKLNALHQQMVESFKKLKQAQNEYSDIDQKYKKYVLLLVAKNGGETQTQSGAPIVWEYIEEAGTLVGVAGVVSDRGK